MQAAPATEIFECPTCGAGRLEAVHNGERTNFRCAVCHDCWHLELGWVSRVPRTTCPGCGYHDRCLTLEGAVGRILS
jgi:hypothetical protein